MRWIKRIAFGFGGLLVILICLFTAGVLWPEPALQPVTTRETIAIANVNIVDMESGTILPKADVLIESGRIVSVANAVAAAFPGVENVRTVDGTGRFLMPALWDMHTHVYATSPLLDLPLYIAYGVTNVRDMQGCPKPDDPFIACAEPKRQWTAEAVAGKRIAPRIVATTSFMANGPRMIERIKGVPAYFGTANAEEARQFVRHFADGVEAIKVYDHIPRDAYFALVDEARRLGLAVVGHRPYAVSALEAAAHQKSMEHARFLLHESFPGSAELRESAARGEWQEDRRRMLDEHDPQLAARIFAAMREHGTWYVPTHLTRWVDAYADDSRVRDDPLLRYLHPLLKWQWLEDVNATLSKHPSRDDRDTYLDFYRKGLELTGAAHRAGVRILAGTDYIVAGADLHRELQQLVAAGLSPAEALRTATLNPAEYFALQNEYGSITPGKVADLILLRGNPLADIWQTEQIEAVVFNGNVYDRAALDRIKEAVERRARSWTIGCKMLWRFIKNPVNY